MRGKSSTENPKKYSLQAPSHTVQSSESRKKVSSFDHENSEEAEAANFEIKPLPTKFYSNLLRLEEKVTSKNFDIETLNEIVSMYAKCVEYYDSVKDPIKYYFLEKIQITLANKASLKIMILKKNDEGQGVRKRKKSQKGSMLDDNLDQINDEDSELEEDTEKEKVKKLPEPNEKKPVDRYNITKKRAERSKRLSLYIQLEENRTAEFNNAENLLQNYENKTQNNDTIIRNDLKAQVDSLRQKLERRKNASILKNSALFENSFLSASFMSDRLSNSLMLEDSCILSRRFMPTQNEFLEAAKNRNDKKPVDLRPEPPMKETNLSPIKRKPQEILVTKSLDVPKLFPKPPEPNENHDNHDNQSSINNVTSNDKQEKPLNWEASSRLKKTEKSSIILPLGEKQPSVERKPSGTGNALPLNNHLLSNMTEFNTESPALKKNLLHEKIQKPVGVNPQNVQLENPENLKKKSQRLFSINILEKVDELSKMEHLAKKEGEI